MRLQRYHVYIVRANFGEFLKRINEDGADAVFFVEAVPDEEASRYVVRDTSDYGEITAVIEKPGGPPRIAASTRARMQSTSSSTPAGPSTPPSVMAGKDSYYPAGHDDAERRLRETELETGTTTD